MLYETKMYLLIDIKHKYSLALLYQTSWELCAPDILEKMLQSSLDPAVPVQSEIKIRPQAASAGGSTPECLAASWEK